MSTESLNAFLIHIFARDFRISSNVRSLHKRYQVLSIIYINLLITSLTLLWIILNLHACSTTQTFMLLLSVLISVPALLCLKNGSTEIAGISTLLSVHMTNLVGAIYNKSSLSCSYSMVVLPGMTFLLSSSGRAHILNTILCFAQNANHMRNVRKTFHVTINDDQAFEIQQAEELSFINIFFMSALFCALKAMENELWAVAQSNYKNAEDLTKETLQAVKAKDAFVSSLSHEVRNPLNSMIGSIEYLLGVIQEPAHLNVLKNAKMGADVLLNLLNNVLDAAKLKAEKMELNYSETNPTEIVRKILVIHSDRLKQKNINSKAHIDKNLPPIIWTDSSRLLQIMMNLFSNSYKFTQDHGQIKIWLNWHDQNVSTADLLKPNNDFVTASQVFVRRAPKSRTTDNSLFLRNKNNSCVNDDQIALEEFNLEEAHNRSANIKNDLKEFNCHDLTSLNIKYDQISQRFRLLDVSQESDPIARIGNPSMLCPLRRNSQQKKRGYLKVQISDTGCGIPQNEIPKLFDMFAQASRTTASIHGGTGLGLWICKQLCQKMGGDIALYSEVNKGTTFVFYIPISNDKLIESVDRPICPYRNSLHALVVDDYHYNRDLHKLLLEREGVQVDTAADGKEALEKCMNRGENFYDFIFMDVQMPKMDGFEATNRIRKSEEEQKWKHTDVYFISGDYYNEGEAISAIKSNGEIKEVSGIRTLRKPIDVKTIHGIVSNYIR